LFLVEELKPWFTNRMSRLVKSPKIHMNDTGLACALLGLDANSLNADRSLLGQLLETFVFQELRKLGSWYEDPIAFHHLRGKDGMEVDFILEKQGRDVVGIEVKASATIKSSDFYGLRKVQEALGKRFKCGIVLYNGDRTVPFGDGLFSVPISAIWSLS